MGVVHTWESKRTKIELYNRNLVETGGIHRRKDDEGLGKMIPFVSFDDEDDGRNLVCVTSGVSYLGLALVNHLLFLGYSVRIIVHNPEEIEKVKEMESNGDLEIVIGKLSDVESLEKAFEGCGAIFHTSAFTDPAGLSGYTKSMAEIEVSVTENVMEACSRTPSIKKCVFTSSLAACVWQHNANANSGLSLLVNHASWSNESLCIDKKLWYALGKMRAEKAAWRIANENGLNLTTICAPLITGPEFCLKNPTATIAYLKGAKEMYSNGLLATVDVKKVVEAHECVYKEMNRGNAYGRYICFDNVINTQNEAEKLANEIRMPKEKICGEDASNNSLQRFQLSNGKLCRLMSRPLRCQNECY